MDTCRCKKVFWFFYSVSPFVSKNVATAYQQVMQSDNSPSFYYYCIHYSVLFASILIVNQCKIYYGHKSSKIV